MMVQTYLRTHSFFYCSPQQSQGELLTVTTTKFLESHCWRGRLRVMIDFDRVYISLVRCRAPHFYPMNMIIRPYLMRIKNRIVYPTAMKTDTEKHFPKLQIDLENH